MEKENLKKVEYRGRMFDVKYDHYIHGNNLAVIIERDGEQYGVASVNIEKVGEDFAYVDENNMPGIGDALVAAGIAEKTERSAVSGFCTYPLYKFTKVQF